MYIVEFQCKKCKYSFTRLFKNKAEFKKLKEKCAKCGEAVKVLQEIDLKKSNEGCSSCKGCSGGGCGAK